MLQHSNKSTYEKLPLAFYQNQDVVAMAKNLIGMVLVSQINDELTSGVIVETEAYCGRGDRACHANNKRTPRTEIMYQQGGVAYVYLCYGMHHLFNVVTNQKGLADAVLIRAIEPIEGIDIMKERRNHSKNLTSGPGVLSQAMGITISMNGISLLSDNVWIARPQKQSKFEVISDVRIGVDYAGEDAKLPWRFLINQNQFVSKKVIEK